MIGLMTGIETGRVEELGIKEIVTEIVVDIEMGKMEVEIQEAIGTKTEGEQERMILTKVREESLTNQTLEEIVIGMETGTVNHHLHPELL